MNLVRLLTTYKLYTGEKLQPLKTVYSLPSALTTPSILNIFHLIVYILFIYIYVQYGTYFIFTYIANSSSIPPSFHLPTHQQQHQLRRRTPSLAAARTRRSWSFSRYTRDIVPSSTLSPPGFIWFWGPKWPRFPGGFCYPLVICNIAMV